MTMKIAMTLVFAVLAASPTFATRMFPNKSCNTTVASNWNHTNAFWGSRPRNNPTRASTKFNVGGSENWHFGFNYTDWAVKSVPFYLNDTLVFKYDPPNDTTFPHSVYLFPNYWSFQNCNLRWAKKIGDVNAGGGQGFEFVLKRWQPHYFGCGEHNGIHCKDGLMKFAVWPLIPWNNY